MYDVDDESSLASIKGPDFRIFIRRRAPLRMKTKSTNMKERRKTQDAIVVLVSFYLLDASILRLRTTRMMLRKRKDEAT